MIEPPSNQILALARDPILPCPNRGPKEFTFSEHVLYLIYAALEGGCKEMTSCLLFKGCKTRPNILLTLLRLSCF